MFKYIIICTFGLRFGKGLFKYNMWAPFFIHSAKNIYSGIYCMCYNLHMMQIINLHGQFAQNWNNSNSSLIVIFACNYTRIIMIACNMYQNWYICSMQTITVCAILSICIFDNPKSLPQRCCCIEGQTDSYRKSCG